MLNNDVLTNHNGPVATIIINRPEARNACTVATVKALYDAFMDFEADKNAKVAVLTGQGDCFCAGADLKELASGKSIGFAWAGEDKGVTRRTLSKPVIA
ncbi:MAG: enoyl-CoA hydratase/isomerase family protein, partial [Deltaproteobacteria bacterium]|nr:enoyl-CoA hydratase/isomerase family protein [Deltaproteobacteria bacterium]